MMTRSDTWKCSLPADFAQARCWMLWYQFGVAEPSIQKQGENRILIQLPGLLDRERAKSLIGQTALLEFKLVKTEEEGKAFYDRVDQYFARKLRGGAPPDSAAPDSTVH